MQEFYYTAKSGPGNIVKGQISAESKSSALESLSSSGLFVLSLKENKVGIKEIILLRKLSNEQRLDFYQRLCSYISAGLDIIEALEIIVEEGVSKSTRADLVSLILDLKNGVMLSDALASYPDIADRITTQLLKAGEARGSYDSALLSIVELLEKRIKIERIIKEAMIYPSFVLLSSFALLFLLMSFVLPKLTGIFLDLGTELPLLTKIVISVVDLVNKAAPLIVLLVIASVLLGKFVLKKDQISKLLEKFIWRSNRLAELILLVDSHRFTALMSSMLNSDIALQDSLMMSSYIVTSKTLREEITQIKDDVLSGKSLAEAIKQSKLKKFIALKLIQVGEKTGKLDVSFLRIEKILEQRINNLVLVLSKILEPAIIVFVGLLVAIIVLALVLPVLYMTNVFV